MTTLIALAAIATGRAQATSIDNYWQTGLQDATLVAEIVKGDQNELKKINSDFGMAYRFTSSNLFFKEPFKMRAEAHLEEAKATYIINGTTEWFKIPGLSQKFNLSRAPGRRQSLMDIGILTPSLFTTFLDAKFIRIDRETREPVFDLTYKKELDDTTRFRVWIDPVKKYVTKREWYRQNGGQKATFFYLNPREVGGVWLPTRMEVKNIDNMTAGVTKYDSIKINTGLADSLFDVH